MVEFKPIFIIGAARSGTKLLRNLVASSPSIGMAPYDINYIWRLGNEGSSDDELRVDQLTPRVRHRIRSKIKALNPGLPFFLEKTVSNCLRVKFVREVFPEALFLHLVRQGEDVIESAYRQWLAAPNWRYILKKAAAFPVLDAFGYGVVYGIQTIHQLTPFKRRRPRIWGPQYRGVREDLEDKELLEVCAIQWLKCVTKATSDMMELGSDVALWIGYEDLVRNPQLHLERIADFIGVDPYPYSCPKIVRAVETSNVGKGGRNLSRNQSDLIRPYLRQAEALLNEPAVACRFHLV